MDEAEKVQLLARASRLEAKMLFVKAADAYILLGMNEKAAAALEKGGDFTRAASLFRSLGKEEDARRCEEKRDGASGKSWQDLQADFQKDSGNPY